MARRFAKRKQNLTTRGGAGNERKQAGSNVPEGPNGNASNDWIDPVPLHNSNYTVASLSLSVHPFVPFCVCIH